MNREYSIYEAKTKLSEIIREVREHGTSVTITYHGKPVAEIRPPEQESLVHPKLAEAVRKGLIAPPTKRMDWAELKKLPRGQDPTGSVMRAVLEERKEGW